MTHDPRPTPRPREDPPRPALHRPGVRPRWLPSLARQPGLAATGTVLRPHRRDQGEGVDGRPDRGTVARARLSHGLLLQPAPEALRRALSLRWFPVVVRAV